MKFPMRVDTVLLDVDGTLIDSTYHHTLAWWQAFTEAGHQVPTWRIHRAIGMGGDRLVSAVAGDDVERMVGDSVRGSWERNYDEMLEEIPVLAGARELIQDLRDLGFRVALASSGIPRHTQHAVDLLKIEEHVEITTSADAPESKPHPAMVQAALERVHAERAVLVGDSVWDVKAANGAGLPVVGVLTGGFGSAELQGAGADVVREDLPHLRNRLDALLALP